MKKITMITALLLSFVLSAGALCACGNNEESTADNFSNGNYSETVSESSEISEEVSEENSDISAEISEEEPETSEQETSGEETEVSEDETSADTSAPDEEPLPDEEENVLRYDVVVYGDTAAAVVSAVAASRQGATVALVAPNTQLGGMMSGGLFATDVGNASVIGGMAKEFFQRNAFIKGNGSSNAVDWYFEPHVAEEIFADMLNETKSTQYPVEVFLGERLVEGTGVEMHGTTITKIICESGKEFAALNFIDASYEGDLMAQAGVSYTYGREGREEYGESLAGVVSPDIQGASNHNFNFKIAARDENGNLKYKEVSEEPLAPYGTGDKKIQAYNFRVCVTNNKSNMLPFPKPEGYDPTRYTLLADYIDAWVKAKGSAPSVYNLFGVGPGVNGKHDFNNNGAFSTDYIGGNYDYPDATYAQRKEIWNDHYNYVAGLFYFLANDPSVNSSVRNAMSQWGIPKDEYVETDNWTFQLYIREGRRMIGEYVMTQRDIEKGGGKNLTKQDTIGMGSYNSDSHNVQRYITSDGYIRNEGNMEVNVDPYEISYRALLPKKAEVDNLLVTCTLSASHVAYSTIRMEPQYMIIGEAAGTAAAISVQDKTKVHDIDVTKLQRILVANGGVLTLTKAELMNCEFEDDFNDWSEWGKAHGAGCAVNVIQNQSSVTLQRDPLTDYSYITRKGFVSPVSDFTFGFRAKLNSEGIAEFTVRSAEYCIRIILSSSENNIGSVFNSYSAPSRNTSLDTSLWHDYEITVKKSENDIYTYDMYVDGKLLWENVEQAGDAGTNIFKIGIDMSVKVGTVSELNVELDSAYLRINGD